MSRPIHARIDLGALRHNHAVARRHAGPSRIWSVIKANGYGHGVVRVARALAGVADGFALIEMDAAQQLRELGVTQPILMMEGFYQREELDLYSSLNLTPVLHSMEQVRGLVNARLPAPMPLYLKLDTGMHRLGLDGHELREALAMINSARVAASVTLMTHFSDADEPRGINEQMARLEAMTSTLPLPRCLANSAALLRFPESLADWVRPGIMLYGASPFPQMRTAAAIGLHPVMSLCSELISTRTLTAGDRLGYGGAFVADRDMRIGLVACGYGDGYPRHAPTGTPVLVDGVRTRTVGRVSMDKICVDLTPLPAATLGTPVTLWGEGLPADEVAMSAGTVSYELFCALASRVPVSEIS
jgi:alanine racemase